MGGVSGGVQFKDIPNNGTQEVNLTWGSEGNSITRKTSVKFTYDSIDMSVSNEISCATASFETDQILTWDFSTTVSAATNLPTNDSSSGDHFKSTVKTSFGFPEGLELVNVYKVTKASTDGGNDIYTTLTKDNDYTLYANPNSITITDSSSVTLSDSEQTIYYRATAKFNTAFLNNNSKTLVSTSLDDQSKKVTDGNVVGANDNSLKATVTSTATYPTYTADPSSGVLSYTNSDNYKSSSEVSAAYDKNITIQKMTVDEVYNSSTSMDKAAGYTKWQITVDSSFNGQYLVIDTSDGTHTLTRQEAEDKYKIESDDQYNNHLTEKQKKVNCKGNHHIVANSDHPITISGSTGSASGPITTFSKQNATMAEESYINKEQFSVTQSSDTHTTYIYLGKNTGETTITFFTEVDSTTGYDTNGTTSSETYELCTDVKFYATSARNDDFLANDTAALFDMDELTRFTKGGLVSYDSSTQINKWNVAYYNNKYFTNSGSNIFIKEDFSVNEINSEDVVQELLLDKNHLVEVTVSDSSLDQEADKLTYTTYRMSTTPTEQNGYVYNLYKVTKDERTDTESVDKNTSVGTLTVTDNDVNKGFLISFNNNLPTNFTYASVVYYTQFVNDYRKGDNSTNTKRWLQKNIVSSAFAEDDGHRMVQTSEINSTMYDTAQTSSSSNRSVSSTIYGDEETIVLEKEAKKINDYTEVPYNYSTHKVGYKITVNDAKMKLTSPVMTDSIDSDDWSYVEDSVKIYKWTYDSEEGGYVKSENPIDYTVITAESTKESSACTVRFVNNNTDAARTTKASMIVSLPDMDAGECYYTIEYDIILNDLTTLATNKSYIDYDAEKISNTATLKATEIPTNAVPSESVSFKKGNSQISKSCWDITRQVSWSVYLNGNNGIIPSTDTEENVKYVTVTDVLPDGLTYIDGTAYVQLYTVAADGDASPAKTTNESGETVSVSKVLIDGNTTPKEGKPSFSYDEKTRTMTIKFLASDLDEKTYDLTYDTYVTKNGTSFSNSVWYGTATSKDSAEEDKTSTRTSRKSSFQSEYTKATNDNATLGTLVLNKTSSSGNGISGATFTLQKKDSNGEYFDKYTELKTDSFKTTVTVKTGEDSTETYTGNLVVDALSVGDYKLIETSASTGYRADEQDNNTVWYFTVDRNHQVKYISTVNYLTSEVAPTTVSIKEITNGKTSDNELIGAQFKLTGSGNLSSIKDVNSSAEGHSTDFKATSSAVTWTSNSTPVKLKGLTAETEYTLEETEAPLGYKKTASVKTYFKVDKYGRVYIKDSVGNYSTTYEASQKTDEVKTIWLTNEKFKDITFDLVGTVLLGENTGNVKQLSGAQFSLYKDNASGTAVKTYEYNGSTVTINRDDLYSGHTYYLVETTVPSGYTKATDITFKVNDDGSISDVTNGYAGANVPEGETTKTIYATDVSNNYITMYNDPHTYEVSFSVNDSVTDTQISASMKLKGGYDNEESTSDVGNLTASLKPGVYTLTETATPDYYESSDVIKFTLNLDGTITATENDDTYSAGCITSDGSESASGTRKITMKNDPYATLKVSTTIARPQDSTDTYISMEEAIASINFEIKDASDASATAEKISLSADNVTYDETNRTFSFSLRKVKGTYTVTENVTDVTGKNIVSKTYTITDGDYNTGANYEAGSEVTTKDGTNTNAVLKAGGTATVAFTNTYETIGAISVTNVGIMPFGDDTGKVKPIQSTGGKMALYKGTDKTKEPIQTWDISYDETSNGAATIDTTKLDVGGTYTISMTDAPSGYEKAKDVTFTLDADGTIKSVSGAYAGDGSGNYKTDASARSITMLSDRTKYDVNIGLVDSVTKDQIVGTDLVLTRVDNAGGSTGSDGSSSVSGVKYAWKSGSDVDESKTGAKSYIAHKLSLTPGIYVLSHGNADSSYDNKLYDSSADITFKVNYDGTLTSADGTDGSALGIDSTNKTVTMTDIPKGHIIITKKVDSNLAAISDGEYVLSDKVQGTKFAIKDSQGKIINIEAKTDANGDSVVGEFIAVAGENEGAAVSLSQFAYDKDKGEWTLDILVSQGTYTVAETLDDIAGFTFKGVSCKVNGADAKALDTTEKTTGASESGSSPDDSSITKYYQTEDVSLEVKPAQSQSTAYTNQYEATKFAVEISVKDMKTSENVAGAKMLVTDKDGGEVASWTAGKDDEGNVVRDDNDKIVSHSIALIAGTYTLSESKPSSDDTPYWYDLNDDITFTVHPDGTVTVGDDIMENNQVSIWNAPYGSITIKKTVTGTVTDKELKEALTYTIKRYNVADEEKVAEENEYTLDDFTYINGTDEEAGYYIMTLYTSSGQVYEVSETVNDIVGEVLKASACEVTTDSEGKEQTLRIDLGMDENVEVAYTASYESIKDITVANIGKILFGQNTGLISDLSGVKVALYKGTDLTTDPIDSWVSGEKNDTDDSSDKKDESTDADNDNDDDTVVDPNAHIISGDIFEVGCTYTIAALEVPTGYEKAVAITFSIDENGDIIDIKNAYEGADSEAENTYATTAKGRYIVMYDDAVKYGVTISMADPTTGKTVSGAKFVLTNKATGDVFAQWTAGEDTNVDGNIGAYELSLTAGVYVLTQTFAPEGYEIADPIEFTVGYDGEISSDDASFDAENMTITMKAVLTPQNAAENSDAKASPIEKIIRKAIKTSDDSMMAVFAIVAIASMLVIAAAFARRRVRR